MIINIRGTSGSGKSWVARQVMARFTATPVLWRDGKKLEGYRFSETAAFLLGAYVSNTGGADTFKDLVDVEEIVERHAELGHVIFEGIRVNGGYERWINLVSRTRHEVRFVLLTTPLEECCSNVVKRRLIKGNDKPLGNARVGIEDHFKRLKRFKEICRDRSFNFVERSSTEAVDIIEGWIRQ